MSRPLPEGIHVRPRVKWCAALAYIPFFCIIPLVLHRANPFCAAHARQGLVLFMFEVALFILHIICGMWLMRLGLTLLAGLCALGLCTAMQGQALRLPFISALADGIQ